MSSRNIKFSAFELDTAIIRHGSYIAEDGYYMCNGEADYDRPVVRHKICEDGYYCDVAEDTVSQYTEFDDKEGEEIYHHDILAFDAKEWYGMNYVDGMEDYLFEVDKSISGEWIGAGLCTEWPTYCKRICSKFERPDLLKA